MLSWHAADDDGVAEARSLFVDDIVDLFEEGLQERRARRPLGAVGPARPGDLTSAAERELRGPVPAAATPAETTSCSAPTAGDRPRAPGPTPLGPLREEQVAEELREHVWSASSLEVWAQCPVKWFVQRMLRAEDLDPEPEPLARGGLAHAALKDTLEGLRERTGSARLTRARLGLAKELLLQALGGREAEFPLSAAPERRPGLRRRLEADLERYLEHAAEHESPLEPTYLELGFGFGEQERDAGPAEPSTDLTPPAPPPSPSCRRSTSAMGSGCAGGSTGWTLPPVAGRRSCTTTRGGSRRRRRSGPSRATCRSRCTCAPSRSCSGWRPRAASTSR